jgi:hypothetical protein
VTFDLAARTLSPGAVGDKSLQGPRVEAKGLAVTAWEDHQKPQLNSRPLALEPYELSRSLAIAPDGKGFLLGADWSLRRFDGQGKEIWHQPVPGVAWAVNLSADGRLAVAGFGDGTVRWYRWRDGRELLALFVSGDGKRWIAWTPDGYYAAAPGTEERIGWDLNQGAEREAQFYPAARFRDRFARADVVERVLQTLDPAEALRLADAERGRRTQTGPVEQRLPPVVRLAAAAEGLEFRSPQLTLGWQVETHAPGAAQPQGERGITRLGPDSTDSGPGLRLLIETSPEAPLTGLKPLVDGRPLGERGIQRLPTGTGTDKELTLNLPERDLTLSLIAENRHGASEPVSVRLRWKGTPTEPQTPTQTPAGPAAEFGVKPKLYALAIGVSAYQNPDLQLRFAAKDARDFAAVIARQEGKLYRQVVTKLLPDATQRQVLEDRKSVV